MKWLSNLPKVFQLVRVNVEIELVSLTGRATRFFCPLWLCFSLDSDSLVHYLTLSHVLPGGTQVLLVSEPCLKC